LEALSKILTRDKLIQIYLNLLQVTRINLSRKRYTDIALGTFTEGTFGNNLQGLKELRLNNNHRRCLWQIRI
jgi:hypothetical protein